MLLLVTLLGSAAIAVDVYCLKSFISPLLGDIFLRALNIKAAAVAAAVVAAVAVAIAAIDIAIVVATSS